MFDVELPILIAELDTTTLTSELPTARVPPVILTEFTDRSDGVTADAQYTPEPLDDKNVPDPPKSPLAYNPMLFAILMAVVLTYKVLATLSVLDMVASTELVTCDDSANAS